MTTTIKATANPDTFSAFHFTQTVSIFADPLTGFQTDTFSLDTVGGSDLAEPFNQFDEESTSSGAAEALLSQDIDYVIKQVTSIIYSEPIGQHWVLGPLYFELFDETTVDYSSSNDAVFVDLQDSSQNRGGFAQDDVLLDVSDVTGSHFDDVIRGSDVVIRGAENPNPDGRIFHVFPIDGVNVLNGGEGNDVLEGRFGSDVLNGGSGFDYASYESSNSGVNVQLAGVNGDTQTAHANFGDAAGDKLISIEGLIGSKFDDTLTGNSLDNELTGGLGNDVLDGKNGRDTADYSNAHLYDTGDLADKVVVHLGLNDANGTAAEFKADIHNFPTVTYNHVSTDTLISIENIVGTAGPDEIFGNEQDNILSGESGNDFFDAGRGNDLVDGGAGIDTVSFASYNNLRGGSGTIDLRPEIGDATFFTFGQLVGEVDFLKVENVIGSNLNETIFGGPGPNTLDGGLGNDTIIGGTSSGPSGDTVSYASHDTVPLLAGEGDTISLGINGADGHYTRSALVTNRFGFHFSSIVETDILRDIQHVTGSNHSETINGNEQDNVLNGRGGNDVINGAAGNDTYDFRGSSLGNDRYFDSSGSDKILVDSLSTFSMSRSGNDLFIKLQTGTITVVNHFAGNPIETITDSHGKSLILATGLIGGAKAGIIAGDNTSEYMDGGGGDDYLFGNGGKDQMFGSSGNDYLDGGKGNDILDGGSGDDQLFGDKGHDTFVFAPVEPDGLPPGDDMILDFVHGQDRIDLTAFGITENQLDQLLGIPGNSSHHHGDPFDVHGGLFDFAGNLGRDQRGNDFNKLDRCGPAGQDPGPITIETVGDDTVLSFDGGSIDVVGVQHLQANDFII